MEPKKLKFFVTIKKNLASIGFSENNSAFDTEQLLRGFEGILAIILEFVYLIHVTSTSREYMESIIMTVAGVVSLISLISMNLQFATIFILMDEFERVINESEYTSVSYISL